MTALPSLDAQSVRTACPYCGVGCGVLAAPDGAGGLSIAGDPAHPANFGRLCSKGSALGETVGLERRLLHPMLRTAAGGYERASWDKALDVVAEGYARIRDARGPDALAFYLSGQLLTEDYYVANKLMKGFLGTANVDTNSRLCMASSVAGHRRAFGSDTVPGCYEDFDLADLIILVGSNAAWCHPVLFQRMLKNRRERGAKLVVIDTRRTATADEADLFLKIAPGMDAVLFAGLLAHLKDSGAFDEAFIGAHTEGLEAALVASRRIAHSHIEQINRTGLSLAEIKTFYELFASVEKTVTAWSQGVNQSAQGTDKVGAIINCHLATGRIGKPGLGPFSITGQPNAMGGREVGGLANMLAAHMGFSAPEVDRVRRFWRAPAMAGREGLKAVAMMQAVAEGRIGALWVMATNPAVSLPRADYVRAALGKLDLLVVSEVVRSNDTIAAGAHVLLPAAAWGEKDGTVTNSERRISRQRPALPLPGEARPDWWIICEVAKRLGFGPAFDYADAAAIFAEHAALSAFENDGSRDFDIGGLAGLDREAYDAMLPAQWPLPARARTGAERLFAGGGFFHAGGKARFIAPETPELASASEADFPLRLNTGRIRDQWHTMTRTGLSPKLAQHRMTPFVEVSPLDAARAGLADGGFARVASPHGDAVLQVRVYPGQSDGALFAAIHWTAENSASGRIGGLVQPMVDPFSGQPEMKATPAAIAPLAMSAVGFLLADGDVALPDRWWWAEVALAGARGWLVAIPAEAGAPANEGSAFFSARFGEAAQEFCDPAAGRYRAASLAEDRVQAALFLEPAGAFPSWEALIALMRSGALEADARFNLLSGCSTAGLAAAGPSVCACFGVGLTAISAAIASGEARSVDDVGRLLKAGTNCGSCQPEIRRLLASAGASHVAA